MDENKGSQNRFRMNRCSGKDFRHYQLSIKRRRNGCTEHHLLEAFAAGPEQLMELRRVYCQLLDTTNFKSALHCAPHN